MAELQYNVPLNKYTSWHVGGLAEKFYQPDNLQDLVSFLQTLSENERIFYLGLGSNVLISDDGIKGTVILTAGALTEIEQLSATQWRVEAGVICAKLARLTFKAGATGFEFLAGIPGTFGGALAMNAGAFGGETWDFVESVETIDNFGNLRNRPKSDFKIAYREVTGLNNEYFVAANINLNLTENNNNFNKIKQLLEQRKKTQPIGEASCGSVFRNPPKKYAAKLIEDAGLKGLCIGDACISEKHANFIINKGSAKATEIKLLIEHIQKIIYDKYKIELITEVHVIK
jgi:UDP-N-acetylmuramate dehydrogenase